MISALVPMLAATLGITSFDLGDVPVVETQVAAPANPAADLPHIVPNHNRTPAGRLEDGRGDGTRDTIFTPDRRWLTVTETVAPGSTFTTTWSPDRPGNWICQCHLAGHTTPISIINTPLDLRGSAHGHDVMHQMGLLVVGIRVQRSTPRAREPGEFRHRLNIVGVLSGPEPERIAAWMAAAPERFIPGLVLDFGNAGAGFSTDSLRSLHAVGRLAVLGEVVNQYAGIAPDDERMEPYGARPVEGDGEGQGAPVTWVREDIESTNRRSPMVMTVLEARVAPERWEALRGSYAQRARLSEEGPVLESFLVQADDDPDTWRIVTVWRDRESLEAMRASGETPTGVLIFRDADAEPRLSIFTVFANPRAAAGSIP